MTDDTAYAPPPPCPTSSLLLLLQQLFALTSLIISTLSSQFHTLLSRLLRLTPRAAVVPHRSVVVITGTGIGLDRELALRFAAAGYHCFVQAQGQAQLSCLLLQWQRLKARMEADHSSPPRRGKLPATASNPNSIAPIGTLIPLVYAAHDPLARTEAVRTIRAYVRENSLELVTLINTVDPARAKWSPPSESGSSGSSSPLGPLSPGSEGRLSGRHRASSGTSSSLAGGGSLGGVHYSSWREVPLPLSISTDTYTVSLLHSALLPSTTHIQDFLPLLRSTRGRVINVWAGPEGAAGWAGLGGGCGPVGVALRAVREATRVLGVELEGCGVDVAVVLPGGVGVEGDSLVGAGGDGKKGIKGKEAPTLPTVSVTNDVRSILTIASDPSIRAHFDSLLRGHLNLSTMPLIHTTDASLIFATVRDCVTAKYPRREYAVGLDSAVARWVEGGVGEEVWRLGMRWWRGRTRK